MLGTRRTFLQATVGGLFAANPWTALAQKAGEKSSILAREVGITTGSFMKHMTVQPQPGKLCLLDLPRIMRDELGMKVIDLMTATLASFEPKYLDQLRAAADKAGCVLTNLKMNLRGLELDSADPKVRAQALAEYKSKLDAAARLGVRWARPLPGVRRPDMDRFVASLRQLIDYAAPHKIQLVIENNGWMQADPDAIPTLLKAVHRNLAAAPDTGNWANNEVRYAGLAKAFPLAVTCDFKALALGTDGTHAAYDLKRCFQIGWDAGFRGPWCLEHFHDDLKSLFREFGLLRDLLKRWMASAK
jgi:hypothetical protein